MWEETGAGSVPRKLIKSQSLKELADDASVSAFYNENRNYILE
jgi:hypothetical protein